VAGFVSDLRPIYASADVVVVPLRVGGGTRIKLLEAFAHEVPVVASGVAAAGLDVADERHLLLVEDAREVPAAVERLVTDAALTRRLVVAAARLVRDRYSTDAVIPEIRDFFRRAAARGRDCLQRSGQR
jgi:glycosyltransferase involved in cell wall biosynthesis